MERRLVSICALAVGLAACSDDEAQLPWPAAGAARTALVARLGRERAVHVHSGDPLRLPPLVGSFDAEDRVVVLHFEAAAEDLGLLEGEIVEAPELPNVGLPSPDAIWTLDRAGALEGSWRRAEALPPPLDSLRLPTPHIQCLLRGGCLRSGRCNLSCTPSAPEPPLEPMPPEPPAPPAPPALPSLGPCPSGWAEVQKAEGVATCDPRPSPSVCTGASVEWLGTTGCAPIGACPAGLFADDLPASGVWFVDPAAPAGGDGSRVSPFRTVLLATTAALAGDTIALARGEFAEQIYVPKGLQIVGACAGATRVSSLNRAGVAIVIGEPGASLSRLTITADDGALQLLAGSSCDVEDVVITPGQVGVLASDAELTGRRLVQRGGVFGIFATGSRVSLEDLVIEGVSFDPFATGTSTTTIRRLRVTGFGTAQDSGRAAVSLDGGGMITLEGALLERAQRGIAVVAPGRVIASDVVVRDMREEGVASFSGAIELRRAHVARTHGAGAMSFRGGSVFAEDVVIEDTRDRSATDDPAGLRAFDRGRLAAHRVWIDRSVRRGLYVSEGADATIADLTLRGGRTTETASATPALEVYDAHFVLERARLTGSADATLLVTTATISDVSSEDVRVAAWYVLGSTISLARATVDGALRGFEADSSRTKLEDLTLRNVTGISDRGALHLVRGEIDASRITIEGPNGIGLGAYGMRRARFSDVTITGQTGAVTGGLSLTALHFDHNTDVTLVRTHVDGAAWTGVSLDSTTARIEDLRVARVSKGLTAHAGLLVFISTVNAARLVFDDFAGTGVLVGGESRLDAEDLRTLAVASPLLVTSGGAAKITRVHFEGQSEIGIRCEDGDTSVELVDLELLGPGACGEGGATGLQINDAAKVVLERFVIAGHRSWGIQVARASELFGEDGEIHSSCVGLDVQTGFPFDFARLEGVKLSDNATPLVLR